MRVRSHSLSNIIASQCLLCHRGQLWLIGRTWKPELRRVVPTTALVSSRTVTCVLQVTGLASCAMQPKSSFRTECPAARAVETVGEWWSILILRDAFQGMTRFDEFQQSLGIAPNILSRRLAHLADVGMFVRRRYNDRPPRYEYLLTSKGRDFFPVLVALFTWGNRHLTPQGEAILLANRRDIRPLDPIMVDAADMHPITPINAVLVPGPRASREMRKRLASLKAMNPNNSRPGG